MNKNDLTYSGALVQKSDPDRFLISLMAPADRRIPLWSLFAFNYEISKTREVVTDTTLGLIRLQWWRDALRKIYKDGTCEAHALLPDLANAIKAYDLALSDFEDLLVAREFDLENVMPGSLEGLETYAKFTQTPLIKMACEICGEETDLPNIESVAIGYGLTGILRAVPYHAASERCYLPADLMAQYQISERRLYEGKPGEGLDQIIKQIADRAFENLNISKDRQGRLEKSARTIARLYLGQLRRAKYNPFSHKMMTDPAFFHMRFLWRVLLRD
jgi:phytoene synthase